MSQWHREHPELVGTDADPWMVNEDYRRLVPLPESEAEYVRDLEAEEEFRAFRGDEPDDEEYPR